MNTLGDAMTFPTEGSSDDLMNVLSSTDSPQEHQEIIDLIERLRRMTDELNSYTPLQTHVEEPVMASAHELLIEARQILSLAQRNNVDAVSISMARKDIEAFQMKHIVPSPEGRIYAQLRSSNAMEVIVVDEE